jgi:hypothetical protein
MRLDDPQLVETLIRARSERAELADEYRRVTSPMVEREPEAVQAHPHAVSQPGQLFVHGQQHAAMGHTYPQALHPPEMSIAASMRPGIGQHVDPAANEQFGNAFQRTPSFSPQYTASA